MNHKGVAIIILMCFSVFSESCYFIKPIGPRLLSSSKEGAALNVKKIDGTIVEGELIVVKQNSMLLKESSSGKDISIGLEDLDALITENYSGLKWGVGSGVTLGLVGGIVLGYRNGGPHQNSFDSMRDGALLGMLVGGLLGGMIGYSISGARTFQIKGKSQEEIRAVIDKLRSRARVSDYQ
jgi:hypothetical protein